MSKLKNIFAQALRPSRFLVMADKVMRRLERTDSPKTLEWLKSNAQDYHKVFNSWDKEMWAEAVEAAELINTYARKKLDVLDFDLGGGGAVPFLYFLVRKMKPKDVVETGVAAGYSSAGILSAMQKNGSGRLYSSDFPYFRLEDPEKYIGYVVDDRLKTGWELHIEGDRNNIPLIKKSLDSIDIFHYDSDKSYAGRSWAIAEVAEKLHKESVVVWDDIQDNAHFMDFVSGLPRDSWWVFYFDGKYVGMLRWSAVLSKNERN